MNKAQDEISHWSEYDYVFINEQLNKTEKTIRKIILAERQRVSQQPQIERMVKELSKEFEARL